MKRVLPIIFIVLTNFICFGQTADEYIDLAKLKLEGKDYNYALTLVEKSIELDTTNVWSRLLKSEVLLELSRVQDAADELAYALYIDTTNAETYNRIGDFFLGINDLPSSLNYYDKAIEYAKSDTTKLSYLANRATAKGVLRDFDGAISDFEEALKLDDTNLVILNNLSAVYQEVGNIAAGIKMQKRLITLYPDFIGPYVNLGLIYSEIDSLDSSEFYFNEALKLDPNEPLLLNNLGYLYYKKKEYPKALENINSSIDKYPNNSYAYRNRALVYVALDLRKEVCKDLEIAVYYNFKDRYGDEVEKLIEKYCNK
jgi:tetratricopeptide (TPR) repeat protein